MSRVNNHQSRLGRILKENGDWINEGDYMERNLTPLNELKFVEKSQQVILNSNIPLSNRRDAITEDNGATVTKINSEYRVRSSTTTNSKGVLQTKQRGNYLPGNLQEAGLGVRIPTAPTGDAYIKWGYFKDTTGIYCEYDATGLYFVVEDNGTERLRVEEANWNQKNLNESLDLSTGTIFQFPFVYYGYGPASLQVGVKEAALFNREPTYQLKIVHSFNMDRGTTISEPNLPLTIEVNSGTSGVQLDCFVGGRQISTYGKKAPVTRYVGDVRTRTSIGTTYVPMVSVRHKSGFENISLVFQKLEVISDADLFYRIIRDPTTLTGASYQTPTGFTASECATEWDRSASAVSGGDVIKAGLIGGQNKDQLTSSSLPDRLLNEGDVYTLAVRTVTGTNATATAFLEITEAW